MPHQLSSDDMRVSLAAHVAAKGDEIFAKYGPVIGFTQLRAILEDRACVRYPCELRFDASRLQAGEVAYPEPLGRNPEEGFVLHVHPLYMTRLADVSLLALYQLVAVNYGEFASPDDAEIFASRALGLDREEFYQRLCALADALCAGTPCNGA
jgi:hypothetical protein